MAGGKKKKKTLEEELTMLGLESSGVELSKEEKRQLMMPVQEAMKKWLELVKEAASEAALERPCSTTSPIVITPQDVQVGVRNSLPHLYDYLQTLVPEDPLFSSTFSKIFSVITDSLLEHSLPDSSASDLALSALFREDPA